MTYNKPEIHNLGDASSVVHGLPKSLSGLFETITLDYTFVPAYDLDE